ncbi:polyprotein [Rocahepevirus ratti]|uniref:Polyprotein n=1 Tax=vole hepatitis E virus TaxID=3070750 RepID=A0AA48DRW4_9VIRU|nr:polyprotein [Rocahepevirus ratti]AVP32821.1 polyprotein [vole hepatitis E virus]
MEAHQYLRAAGVTTALEAAAVGAAAASLANAYEVPVFVSQRQAELLVSLFSPLQLTFNPQRVWSHPIQRVIHNYLEGVARAKAGSCLEVGAHPRSVNEHPNVQHRCFLPPVGRDVQRWLSCPRRGAVNNMRRCALTGAQPPDMTFCFSGFHQCRHYAEVGLALYSLHDLPPATVAKVMRQHGMKQLFAVLHLPPEVMLPVGVYPTPTYVARNIGDRIVVTYTGDTSAGYDHDRAILRKWVKVTRVGGCCALVVERVRAIGCHFLLSITAVNTVTPMPYTPYPNADTIYVRSLFSAGGSPGLLHSVCTSARSTFHAVPASIWDRLMLFGVTLDDDAFCCSRPMTYLRGISFKVVVGTQVANEGWTTDEFALTAVVVAAYLTICHQRWIRTQGISKGVRRLTFEHAQGFLNRLLKWFGKKIGGKKDDFITGRQLEFYKLCEDWVSAGCYFDPRALCFDKQITCPCKCTKIKAAVKAVREGFKLCAPKACKCIGATFPGLCSCFLTPQTDNKEPELYSPSSEASSIVVHPQPQPAAPIAACSTAQGGTVYYPKGLDNFTCKAVARALAIFRATAKKDPNRSPCLDAVAHMFFWASAIWAPATPVVDSAANPFYQASNYTSTASRASGSLYDALAALKEERIRELAKGDLALAEELMEISEPAPRPQLLRFESAVDSGVGSPLTPTLPPFEAQQSAGLPPLPKSPAARVIQTLPDGSQILEGSLFSADCDWLVNASNPDHIPGGGVCGQFHRKFPQAFEQPWLMTQGLTAYTATPRQIIHAVAPDYRSQKRLRTIQQAYYETLSRVGTAAYPLLGTGIYQVPFGESIKAWIENHRPGDKLYLTNDAAQWYEHNRDTSLIGTKSLVITPQQAAIVNIALQKEASGNFGKFVGNAVVAPGLYQYLYTAGVPGSGKSTGIRREDVDVVVVPTQQLRQQWLARGFNVYTQHAAIRQVQGVRVLVDEAPAMPPHILCYIMSVASSVHLLGDPNQIPALDFDHTGLVEAMRPRLDPTEWRMVSHRCPQDVCYLLAADYPGIKTTSKKVRSLDFVTPPPPDAQKIVFTQAAKSMYPAAITVHEAQGSTFNTTALIVTNEARGLIMCSRAHAIVALTRHVEKCYVVDKPGLLKEIGVSDAILGNFYQSGAMQFYSRPSDVERPEAGPVSGEADLLPASCQFAALHQLSESTGHRPQVVRAVIPPGPPVEQGTLYMPFKLDGREEVVTLALSDTVHCRMAAPTHRLAVLTTLVGRYAKKTRYWAEPVQPVRRSLEKFIPKLPRVVPSTVELGELVKAMQDKGQDGSLVVQLDLADKDCTRITFFQKDCNKFTLDETIAHGKVGQGISAWSKTAVALFGVWFRAIEKAIVDVLPPNVLYGDQYAPETLSSLVESANFMRVFENDFSEFDSTQNNFSLALECEIMVEVGMPLWLVNLYHLIRSAWVLQAPQEGLKGVWKKHSGEPGTLLWNTVWNMAVIAHCYEFQDLAVAAFKGDDSVVCCSMYTSMARAADLITGCGLKLKVNFNDVGSFAGLIVCPGVGVVCDVVRFVGRLTEKNWGPGSERTEELREAVVDFLKKIANCTNLVCMLNSMYYGYGQGLIMNLVGLLKTVVEGRASFVELVQPVLKLVNVGKKE